MRWVRGMTHSAALTVSVVIPVKDDDIELDRCLRALARQTRVADEVVVVDNGSTDASAAVARRHGARVVPCAHPGIPAASAAGYDAATGDVILRLDADCVPDETWVQTMTDAFADRPDVDAFTGSARFIGGPPAVVAALSAIYLLAYAAVMTPTLGHPPLFGSNLGLRRASWHSVRAHVHRADPELHDDIDLAYHLGERGRIRFLPGARMEMSLRALTSGRSLRERTARGFRTVAVHLPRDLPPIRLTRRALRRALGNGVRR